MVVSQSLVGLSYWFFLFGSIRTTSFSSFPAKSLDYNVFHSSSVAVSETGMTSFLSHQVWSLATCPTGLPSFFLESM